MRNRLHKWFLVCTAPCMLTLFSGCVTTGPAKFYTLNATILEEKTMNSRDLSVMVGPVEIPDYLDRPHIVTRTGRNELTISDFHKWAGSLQNDISRVLVDDLSASLLTEHVYTYPWPQHPSATYHVKIKINQFEGAPGEQVILKASWALYGNNETSLLTQRSTHVYEETGEKNYSAVVAAMSRALGKLSAEIAVEIRSLSHL